MAIITQSTIVKGTVEALFQTMSESQRVLQVPSKEPSLSIHGPKFDRDYGHILESEIHYGLFSISFRSIIEEYRPNELIKSTLLEGPFDSWVHSQTFQISGEQVIVQDCVEYSVSSEPLENIIKRLVFSYPTSVEVENTQREKKTQKFQAIRRNLA